jgi:hypothetical protein
MNTLLLLLALLAPQLQLPSREGEQVVVLTAPHAGIATTNGGKLVQLKYETTVYLPEVLPTKLPNGTPWYVDIVNFGPDDTTVSGGKKFAVHLHPDDKVRIFSDGSKYSVVK